MMFIYNIINITPPPIPMTFPTPPPFPSSFQSPDHLENPSCHRVDAEVLACRIPRFG